MSETILFHTHGLGPFDFSRITAEQLSSVNDIAAARSAYLCISVFLRPTDVDMFLRTLEVFARRKADGALPRILGFALEGPILGPHGGLPTGTVWKPNKAQCCSIVSCLTMGLKYVVASPDLLALDDELDQGFTFADFISLVYDAGGRVAFGHFSGGSPAGSSARVTSVLEFLEANYQKSPYLVLTDHLFNDMPRNFRHAFRTTLERVDRDAALANLLDRKWSEPDLPHLLGAVPAMLITAAKNGRLTPALNFDGSHVDLEICRRVVEYLGTDRVIAMTDHTEGMTLAGEQLVKGEESKLLYRADGVLAASAVTHEQQRLNMAQIGLDQAAIAQLTYQTPLAALSFVPRRISSISS